MPSNSPAEIRWLHLSDFHFRTSSAWSQDVVLQSLLEDVRARYSGLTRPDLLFITGDVAFSGKTDEYTLAEDFVRRLQDVVSIPSERLFIIAGNHDIDRSLEEDAFLGVQQTLTNPDEVDRFLTHEGRRRTLFRRQTAFRNFVNRLAPPAPSPYSDVSFAHWKQTRVGPLTIVVLLLDSAWLSAGGDADAGRLIVGERQVFDAHASSPRPALTFGLVHHPFAWLKEFEQVPIENLILDRVQVMLRGHVHAADLRTIEALEHRLSFFTAGATFQTRTSNNSYGYVALDLLTGRGELTTHRYIHAENRWQPSAPQVWHLLDRSKPQVPLPEAAALFKGDGRPYSHYKALLVAGHVTEVPRYLSGGYVRLSFEVDVPDSNNSLAPVIYALRHLFHWRPVWDPAQWNVEVARLSREFHTELDKLAQFSEAAVILSEREYHCAQTTPVLLGTVTLAASPLLDELTSLVAAQEFSRAAVLIERARTTNILRPQEEQRVKQLDVLVLLGLNRPADALRQATELLTATPSDAERMHLVAQCYYESKAYPDAAAYMHRALDAGLLVDRARRLALLISGQAGDASLAQRVRG